MGQVRTVSGWKREQAERSSHVTSTTDRLLAELPEFLSPVFLALESPAGLRRFLRRLGHDPSAASVEAALSALAVTSQGLTEVVNLYGEKAWANEPLDEADYVRVASHAPNVVRAVRDLPSVLEGVDLGPDFSSELLDILVVDYLRFRSPAVLRMLMLLGVIEIDLIVPGDSEEARALEFERYRIRWQRLQRLMASPSDLMEEVYAWGGAEFAADQFLTNVALLFDELGVVALPCELPEPLSAMLDDSPGEGSSLVGIDIPLHRMLFGDVDLQVGLIALPVKGMTAPVEEDRGIGIMPYVSGAVVDETPVTDDGAWTFRLEADAGLAGGVVFRLHPSGLQVDSGVLDSTVPAGSFRMELEKVRAPGKSSILVFGSSDGTRMEAEGFAVGVGGDAGDFYAAAAISGLRLVLDVSDDGLLSQIISEPMVADAGDVVGGWRLGRGIYFEKGSALSVRIPLDADLFGVLHLRQFDLKLGLEPNASVTTLVSADASIGPLSLSFDDLGLKIAGVPNPDGIGGLLDLETRILFPTGYAAALNTGPIQGGGALFLADNQYRGALALKFESFGLSAFAILTTGLGGGRDGFSFVASIFGDVDVPLGSGFFLVGLGGIIGINRTADTAALREAMVSGGLDRLLFPSEPIADATQILQDLDTVFPAREGQHVFGPMARIIFGRPPLVEGKMGLVLEVGAQPRVLILGSIRSDLPSKDVPLVSLRLAFFGEIDLAARTVSVDATLAPGSQVLGYLLSGDMAARTGWAPRIDHVISFGGLHPAYPRPANLPDLSRLSINFGSNNPRVTLSAYLAVTTNSLQFGADATLYAKGPDVMFVGQLAAEGELYLHALVYFDPFAFDANMGGSLSLLVDGDVMLSLGFSLHLSGPNPFEVAGRVWATVFGVDVGFDVEHSWGEPRALEPPNVDPVAVLRDALATGAGVEPIPSTARTSGAAFAPEVTGPAGRVVDPAAGVRYLQRALPLGVRIEKLGEAVLAGGSHRYDLAVLGPEGDDLALSASEADFVRGQYWALTEDERLRAPAFERHRAGFTIGGEDLEVRASSAVDAEYGYEVIVMSGTGPAPVAENAPLADAVLARWSGVHRQEVAQPLNPEAVAGIGRGALTVRVSTYVALGDDPAGGDALSSLLESYPNRGRSAAANPVLAAYVAAAAGR